MNLIFALNGLSYLAVSLIAFYIYYYFCKKQEVACTVGKIIGVNGIFYLLIAFLNFLWVFNFIGPSDKDLILMNAVVTVVSSILILYSVYKIIDNKNLIYIMVLFLTVIFAINFSITAFFMATLAVSYLLMLIVFLDLAFYSNFYLKKAGIIGISYVVACALLLAFTFLGTKFYNLFWFIPNILMYLVFLFIYLDVKNLGIIKKENHHKKKKFINLAYAAVFVRFLVYMISISAFIFVSTISIHELGHALVAQYYGCGEFKAVIYDIIAPHTEIRCDTYYNNITLTMAGVAATLLVGLVFILTGGEFIRGISYLLFGFGLLVSYGDLIDLEISKNIISVVLLASAILIIMAVVKISVYQLRRQNEK